MTGLVQIDKPSDFSGWKTLDWSLGPVANPRKINPRRSVYKDTTLYSAGDGFVVINEGGPPAQLQYCGPSDYRVNLALGEGMVIARAAVTGKDSFNTPLFLRFEKPIRALGAYVSAAGGEVEPGAPLHAILWTYTTQGQAWTSVFANGVSGIDPLGPNDTPAAPFLGVDAKDEGGLKMVCFDISLLGKFDRLALGSLLWA